ncbi:MAG: hypothetical protein DDT40_01325 [candidate division WS2 bacterium]|nr:hypothetical protein [Candidatus Psychracetigena formicireducens]
MKKLPSRSGIKTEILDYPYGDKYQTFQNDKERRGKHGIATTSFRSLAMTKDGRF